MAWRWRTPPEFNGVLKLNLLEFLYSSMSIYMTIHKLGQGYQIIAFTDISSALGWINEALFDLVK